MTIVLVVRYEWGVNESMLKLLLDPSSRRYNDMLIVDVQLMMESSCRRCGLTHEGLCTTINRTYFNFGKSDHPVRMCQNVRNSNMTRTKKPNPGGEGGQMSAGGQLW